MKIALVYDRINKWGGAERTLLALHELFPDAPLYTSVYDQRLAPWAKVLKVNTSFLQKLPLPKGEHEMYPYLMGIAFESFNFDEYDVVITVTHEFAKAIITKPKTLHLCYSLTPTGYLWAGHEHYFYGRPKWFRAITWPVVKYLRWYDKIIAQRPDSYIAISQTVQERIRKYYNRESKIIYPPAEIPQINSIGKTGDYFLIVSRLVPNKRLDIAVEAFNKLGLPLKIVGIGKEEGYLRKQAKPNIHFLGSLTEEELASYYNSCLAVIVPGEEDFNIVAVEAQSHGKAVIAYGKGGVLETVVEGKTGWFFQEHSPKALEELIQSINLKKIKPEDCFANARRFSKERFKKEFQEFVEKSYQEYQKKHVL